MAADFQLHVALKDQDIRDYITAHKNTIGSKYEDIDTGLPDKDKLAKELEEGSEALINLERCPGVWLGQLSWLKEAIRDEDEPSCIPTPLMDISELVGEDFPILDEFMIQSILRMLQESSNNTQYSITGDFDTIETFLRQHHGRPVFTMSW